MRWSDIWSAYLILCTVQSAYYVLGAAFLFLFISFPLSSDIFFQFYILFYFPSFVRSFAFFFFHFKLNLCWIRTCETVFTIRSPSLSFRFDFEWHWCVTTFVTYMDNCANCTSIKFYIWFNALRSRRALRWLPHDKSVWSADMLAGWHAGWLTGWCLLLSNCTLTICLPVLMNSLSETVQQRTYYVEIRHWNVVHMHNWLFC